MNSPLASALRDSWVVFCKEIVDAFRDRKTLLMIFLTAVLIGPVVLVAVSFIVGQQEDKSERREVWVAGLAQAPELHNYLLRQGMTVYSAPVDYEARLADFSRLPSTMRPGWRTSAWVSRSFWCLMTSSPDKPGASRPSSAWCSIRPTGSRACWWGATWPCLPGSIRSRAGWSWP